MPLTPSERDTLREQLKALIADLESRVDPLTESSRPPPGLDSGSIGRLSRMDAMQSQEMSLAGLRRLKERLARAHVALTRIDKPEFGHCESCGGAIGLPRLEFDPGARCCVKCAS